MESYSAVWGKFDGKREGLAEGNGKNSTFNVFEHVTPMVHCNETSRYHKCTCKTMCIINL